MSINQKLLNLANFDLIHIENAVNHTLNFTETNSYSDIFDQAGYNGSNFILGIGLMFPTIVYYFFYLTVRAIAIKFL